MRLETNLDKNLTAYAQAFERCPEYKLDMDLPYGVAKHNIQDRDRTSLSFRSKPYKSGETYQPVEEGLERSAAYSDANDIVNFKTFRRITLSHLEDDYGGIKGAASALNSFIKYHKSECGIFDPKPHCLPYETCPRRDAEMDDILAGSFFWSIM